MNSLDKVDVELFFATMRVIMDYANRKFHIDDKVDFLHDNTMDLNCCKEAADKIWEKPVLIDEILRTADISEEQHNLLASWKNCIQGTFFIERHLKDGSIFMDSNKVYQVLGITDPLKDTFAQLPLPLIVNTTLLPFNDVIITDGLFSIQHIMLGPDMRSGLKEAYMHAKQNKQIVRQLPVKEQKIVSISTEKPAAKNIATIRKNGKSVNLYRLKVYPNGSGRSVYRIIEICGNATLAKLCSVILDAFNFTHEHAYEFLFGGCGSYQSDPDYGERSVKVHLESLDLIPKQKFFLHYDFGDDWMFTIHVDSVCESSLIRQPRVIKRLGNIRQYPDGW